MQTAASICCRPDEPPLAEDVRVELAERLRALADPTRLGIVNRLASVEELCVCDLTDSFGLSQPTISHHLRVLRDAGLVDGRKQGTWSYYRLNRDAIAGLAHALAP